MWLDLVGGGPGGNQVEGQTLIMGGSIEFHGLEFIYSFLLFLVMAYIF